MSGKNSENQNQNDNQENEENEAITNPVIENQNDEPKEKKLDPGFKRNIKIIGGVFFGAILIVILLIVVKATKADPNTSAVNLGISSNVVTSGNEDKPLSPAMKESITKKLSQEQIAAEAKGEKVHLPAEILEIEQPIKVVEQKPNILDPVQTPVVQQTTNTSTASVAQQNTFDPDSAARRRAGMERQLAGLIAEETKSVPVRIMFPASATPAVNQVQTNQAQTFASPASTPSLITGPQIMGALEIVSAEIASPIDTYKTTYTSARIVAGKLAGAFLVGNITQTQDGVQIVFNQMRIGQKSYAVDVIALDEKTATNAIDGKVDRRYLQRWVLPIISATVGGYATAASKTATAAMAVTDVAAAALTGASAALGTAVVTPAPTSAQARSAGVASGIGIFQKEIDKEAAKPFQITIDANTPIGLLFRQAVIDKN